MEVEIDKNWIVDFPDDLFINPMQVRLDLTEEKFAAWKKWYREELLKCDLWSSVIEDMDESELSLVSDYDMYKDIAEALAANFKGSIEPHYPIFDPLFARHLPETGWVEVIDDEEYPIQEDSAIDWADWFPKRSCISCKGARGEDPDGVWRSWCPIINDFMEKNGRTVDRSLEKFAKPQPGSANVNIGVPKVIHDFLKKAIEQGDHNNDGENGNAQLN